MEIKKSPKADLERSKLTSTLIGLVVALGILYIAFEWVQTETKESMFQVQKQVEEQEEMAEITFREETPPPPEEQPEEQPVIDDILEIKDNAEEVKTVAFANDDDKDEAIEVREVKVAVVEEEEEDQTVHIIVEKKPEFPGGEQAMNRWLTKNIKYPLLAQENGIQGRVVCEFVVNKDGSIVDVKVLRGVEDSLDAEAVRVIKSMPKWTPGKQGGKAVRVKYTLPIKFKLQ